MIKELKNKFKSIIKKLFSKKIKDVKFQPRNLNRILQILNPKSKEQYPLDKNELKFDPKNYSGIPEVSKIPGTLLGSEDDKEFIFRPLDKNIVLSEFLQFQLDSVKNNVKEILGKDYEYDIQLINTPAFVLYHRNMLMRRIKLDFIYKKYTLYLFKEIPLKDELEYYEQDEIFIQTNYQRLKPFNKETLQECLDNILKLKEKNNE